METIFLVGTALSLLMTVGYLAACAGAECWLPFFDWLLLRKKKPNRDSQRLDLLLRCWFGEATTKADLRSALTRQELIEFLDAELTHNV